MPEQRSINYPALYEYRFKAIDQTKRERVWAEIAISIYNQMGCPQYVLDPAAGRGEFINAIPAVEKWAVDFVDQSSYYNEDVKSMIGDVFETDLPASHFDGIFVSNFLEHLQSQENVAGVLKRLLTFLTPGGRLGILGPNFKYCYRKYFDCADHMVPITHISLSEHLYAAGYQILKVIPRYLPFSFRGLLPPSASLTRTYLRLPPIWKLVGQQFFIVAQRPAEVDSNLRNPPAINRDSDG